MAETNPVLEPDLDSPEAWRWKPTSPVRQWVLLELGANVPAHRRCGQDRGGLYLGAPPQSYLQGVCYDKTGHAEVVRVHFDPTVCSYLTLLDVFWGKHDPTTVNRQGNDVGTKYRSGIYYYNEEQAKRARESLEAKQKGISAKIVTEILPAKKFYCAEEYHQQYLEKGGSGRMKQSARKGCKDPIRCYG